MATQTKRASIKRHVEPLPREMALVRASAPEPAVAENLPATQEMIAVRAYEIWQRHGCPAGTAFQDWLAAEAELRLHH
jgi:hypothetical protein